MAISRVEDDYVRTLLYVLVHSYGADLVHIELSK